MNSYLRQEVMHFLDFRNVISTNFINNLVMLMLSVNLKHKQYL